MILLSFYYGFISKSSSQNSDIYVFNTSNLESKNIKLFNNYDESNGVLNNKIAPGTKGELSLIIYNDMADRLEYSFTYTENRIKPSRSIL